MAETNGANNSNGSTNPHSDPLQCMQLLQSTPVILHYLAEGNANVIYSIEPTPGPNDDQTSHNGTEVAHHDHCCVLRMRKDLPTTRSCSENLNAISKRINPLFPAEYAHLLMPKELYPLNAQIMQQADSILADLASRSDSSSSHRSRSKDSPGHPTLEEEPHAILMPNLRYGDVKDHDDVFFREFKPKWLLQSPSAPSGARRCRTCAANAVKRAAKGKRGKGDSGFCPLDLLSDDREILRDILKKIMGEGGEPNTLTGLVDDFVKQVQPVLRHMQKLQGEYSTEGMNDATNPEGRDYAVAMALRDCSVFLVLHRAEDGGLSIADIKFADLDLKIMTQNNLDKWAKLEGVLIESGAYTMESMAGSNCALER